MITAKPGFFMTTSAWVSFMPSAPTCGILTTCTGAFRTTARGAGLRCIGKGCILTDFWFNIGGGDGFHTQNDPTDWRTVYGESQGGMLQRTNVETRESKVIEPRGPNNILNYNEYYPAGGAAQGAAGAQPLGLQDPHKAAGEGRPSASTGAPPS